MKEHIINETIKLIESTDPMSFSVARVAKAMGISQGNLTYYFPKREDLVEAVVDRFIVRYTSNPDFDFTAEKDPRDLISKKFLRMLLADAKNPAIVKTMVFIWSNALTNERVAQKLACLYRTPVEVHLEFSGNKGTVKQSQTTYALFTITSIINGLVPVMGIADTAFDYEEFASYLESLLRRLLFDT
ncbi:TetR/AcrR family transcriptional regulator [Alishewanella longhuensis]